MGNEISKNVFRIYKRCKNIANISYSQSNIIHRTNACLIEEVDCNMLLK